MAARKKAAVQLTARDRELLLTLYKYRYLSLSQVRRLHFPSAQTATRRLRLLEQARYVALFKSPAVSERMVMLAEPGAQLVAKQLDVAPGELGWTSRTAPKDYLFLQHFLAISDVRILLTETCASRDDLTLLGFIPEHVGHRTTNGSVEKYIREVIADLNAGDGSITHTPDAVFALAKGNRPALFFLEIDRGTETIRDTRKGFGKTLRFYLASLASGAYQRYHTDFGLPEPFPKPFRALVVTSSVKRLANIRAFGASLPAIAPKAKQFIWLTTEEILHSSALTEPLWVTLDPDHEARYAMIPSP